VNPLGLSSEGNGPSTWGTGVKMAIHTPVYSQQDKLSLYAEEHGISEMAPT